MRAFHASVAFVVTAPDLEHAEKVVDRVVREVGFDGEVEGSSVTVLRGYGNGVGARRPPAPVSAGDDGYDAAWLAWASKDDEITRRTLDAAEAAAENTEALKDFGGTLGFQYGGQPFADLAGMGLKASRPSGPTGLGRLLRWLLAGNPLGRGGR